ncbi:fructose-bisphosphatase class II [Enterobacter hormaechei]
MKRELAIPFSRLTEAAGLARYNWVGRGDKNNADRAAGPAMRHVVNPVSYSHLTLPPNLLSCTSRWSPDH